LKNKNTKRTIESTATKTSITFWYSTVQNT